MRLDGIHHVTCITGDAPGNVDFYAGVLGLRLVKKSVNQDDPTVYHLFYADEQGSAGSDITFFEYPGAAPGRAGAGMIHTVVWRVGSEAALDFWAARLGVEGVTVERAGETLRFADPEGLAHRARRRARRRRAAVADHPEIPRELALQGFEGVLAYTPSPRRAPQPLSRRARLRADRPTAGRRAATARRLDRATSERRPSRGVPGARHRPPRRLVVADGRPRGLAAARRRGRRPADAGHRPLLVPLDLLPRAERRPVRDRDARARVRHRRGSRASRRDADPAAELRAPARQGRAAADAASRSRGRAGREHDPARARAARGRGARGRARPAARPRRRRARPPAVARPARPAAPPRRLHAARAARTAAGRRALVRRAARRLSRPGELPRRGSGRSRSGSTGCRSRPRRSCSAASRRARSCRSRSGSAGAAPARRR